MVHCVSSSEPDAGDQGAVGEDWHIISKEMMLNQSEVHGKTLVESTVTTGIQVGTDQRLYFEQAGKDLPLVDTHRQPADTTHVDNSTMCSNVLDGAAEQSMDDAETHQSALVTHYQPLVYHDGQCTYRQQHTLIPDHTHYTATQPNSNFHLVDVQPCEDEDIEGAQVYGLDSNPDSYQVAEKYVSLGPNEVNGIYPHLYNFRQESNGQIAFVNCCLPTKQATFINPLAYNQLAYAESIENCEESSDSSSEDV